MDRQPNVNETLPAEREAINELFAQHYRASLRIAFRILRSNEDANDAVQNAYCEAFRHFDNFRGESSFKTWITRIVVNCCSMHLRERRRRPQVPLDDVQPVISQSFSPHTHGRHQGCQKFSRMSTLNQ
jgi:RNA polymerase sigma factor (sigma-70 family)